jgi:transposase
MQKKQLEQKIPKDVLEDLYLKQKQSLTEIAKRFDCSPSGVRKLMKRYNIEARSPFKTGKPLKEIITKETAIELYINRGMSPQQIAKEYNCSDVAIRNLLKAYQIELIPTKIRDLNSLFNQLSKEQLYEYYYNQGLSAYEIGKKFNVSHTAILSLMDEYGFIRAARKKRTEESAIDELLEMYTKFGAFSSSKLQKENSGLEKYLRDYHNGLRAFCKKHGIEYILTEPKKQNWNIEKVIKTIKDVYHQYKKPVGQTLLIKAKVGGLYQWITNNYGPYRKFCEDFNLLEYAYGQKNWNDAKCFRLIKEMFIINKGPIYPEMIKEKEKGAYQYIYEVHGSFQEFIDAYDLHDYIDVNNIRYNEGLVKRLFMEAYYRKGELVNAKWLVDNGYHGVYKYITDIGEGSYIEGCKKLGISNYATSAYTEWTDKLAIENINKMFEKKQGPIISADFQKNKLTGLRDWIVKSYGSLEAFFEHHNIIDKYANMSHIGKELWAYGKQFELLAKEVIELLFEDVIYDKWVESKKIRPDFIIGETGLWIDAKLSSFAYFTDETVEKYTKHEECKELWILYLRGHTFRVDNPKVKIIAISNWYEKIRFYKRDDLIERIENLRKEIREIESSDT